jgi:hypothetical protein
MIYVLRYPGIGIRILLSLCYELRNNIMGIFFIVFMSEDYKRGKYELLPGQDLEAFTKIKKKN